MKNKPVPLEPRTCISCEHWDLELGEGPLSDVTPGAEGHLTCYKGHYDFRNDGLTNGSYRDALRKAATCPDFKTYEKP